MDILRGFSARPLVAAAVLYLLGTLYGLSGLRGQVWVFVGCGCMLIFMIVASFGACRKRGPGAAGLQLTVHIFVFGLGACLSFFRCRPVDAGSAVARCLTACEVSGNTLDLAGEIISDPDVVASVENGCHTARFTLHLSSILDPHGRTLSADDRFEVTMHGVRDPYPRYGESWCFRGRVLPSTWAHARVPRYIAVWQRDSKKTGEKGGVGFFRKCYAVRRWAALQLAVGIEEHEKTVAMMQALLLGYRSRVDPVIRTTFADTGAVHVFAISGLHVGIVAMMIIVLLRALRVSRERWVLVLAPILIAYTATTGMRASAVRACLMAIVYFAGPLLGRKPDGFSALAFAALVIMVVSPAQATDIGFIFSFTVVLGLISLYRICYRPFRGLTHADELRLQPEGRPMVLLRKFASWAASLFALSSAAWLTSAPLTAYVFGRFSIAALISNFAVVPVTAAIVTVGFLSLIAGSCVSILGVWLNHINLVCVNALLLFVRTAARMPCACLHVDHVPVWAVVLWYVVLAAAAFWLNTRMGKRAVPATHLGRVD